MRNPFLKKNGETFEGEKDKEGKEEEKEFVVRCWFFDRPLEKEEGK
jgi:hypothetical protein